MPSPGLFIIHNAGIVWNAHHVTSGSPEGENQMLSTPRSVRHNQPSSCKCQSGLRDRTTWLALTAAMCLVAATAVQALDQAQANALVDHLKAQLGRNRGIVEAPRCGNGTLVRALAERTAFTIHATDSDPSDIAASKEALAATFQVGTRGYAEPGPITPLKPAARSVDLIVLYDLTDGELASIDFDNIQQTLCPGGKAYVGRATAEGAGLTESALQTWVSGKSDVTVTTDAQGVWAVIGRQELAGVDTWTHRYHGPDNNPASADQVADWPGLLQYRAKPYKNGRYGSVLSANGRLFILFNDGNRNSYRYLRAFRIYNGQMLWTRNCQADWGEDSEVYPASYSSVVVQGDYVFMMKQGSVLKLDAETGARVDSLVLATGAAHLRWIAIDNNILYGLAGDPANDANGAYYGNTVIAWNLGTATQAWSQTESGLIDNRQIAIAGGTVFYYVNGQKVVARNSATGAQSWVNSDGGTIGLLTTANDALVFCVGGAPGILASSHGVYICTAENPNYVALSAADGSPLWNTTYTNNRAEHKVIIDDIVYSKSVADHNIMDEATGQPVSVGGFNWGAGCGPISGTPNMFFGNAGQIAGFLGDYQKVDYRQYKIDCSTPVTFSNGFTIYANAQCGCPDLHRGIIADAPAEGFDIFQNAVETERRETGPALGSVSGTVTVGANDWWTYRANNSHTGKVAATLPSSMHLMWTCTPPVVYDTSAAPMKDDERPDMVPTPPVVVGDRIFWGGSDGYVRCAQNGAEQWSYSTGGRIIMAPTVANGCVYAGSADGYAYCLDAADGRLVWRFRAAPVERRVNLYGLLASTWPVVTGVTVHNGNAYFAAGIDEAYGTYVFCVNALTGSLVWENNTSSVLYGAAARQGITPSGVMAIVGNKLWLKSHHSRNGIYDLATGATDSLSAPQKQQSNEGPTRRGMDICVVDPQHVVYGGRTLYADRRENGQYVRAATYLYSRLDAQGTPLYPEIQTSDWASEVTPAFDDQNFFYVMQGEWTLECWSTSRFTATIDSIQAANDVTKDLGSWPWWKEWTITPDWCSSWQEGAPTTPMSTWRQPDTTSRTTVRGMALGSNALAVLQKKVAWMLSYLDRTDGSIICQTALPKEPMWGGIALGADGIVYVSFVDGSIGAFGSGAVSVASYETITVPTARDLGPLEMRVSGWQENSTPTSPSPLPSTRPPVNPSTRPLVNPSTRPTAYPLTDSTVTLADNTQATLADVATEARTSEVYQPRSMQWAPERPAVAVTVLESSGGSEEASRTLDHDLRTWWSGTASKPQWVTYDLGAAQDISSATLVLYSRSKAEHTLRVELSLDGEHFETVDEGTLVLRGTTSSVRSFLPQTARYVRVSLDQSDGPAACVYEVALHKD